MSSFRDFRKALAYDCIIHLTLPRQRIHQIILWYLSKEVVATEDNGEVRAGDVIRRYSFWSALMVNDDASPDLASPDLFLYPSQSSILATHSQGWQVLASTQTIEPPTVEILD
jgi:hypothetical protein